MLCCVGLFGGLYVGEQLGGPWTYIAPAVGFGVGLIGDMKFMHKSHKHSTNKSDENDHPDPQPFQISKNKLPDDQHRSSNKLFTSESKYPDPP